MNKNNFRCRLLALLVPVIFYTGCTNTNEAAASGLEPCSPAWFFFIEKTLETSDSQGHGPDMGSAEWKSVVEFKLGVRDNPKVPTPASNEWCEFIDKLISG